MERSNSPTAPLSNQCTRAPARTSAKLTSVYLCDAQNCFMCAGLGSAQRSSLVCTGGRAGSLLDARINRRNGKFAERYGECSSDRRTVHRGSAQRARHPDGDQGAVRHRSIRRRPDHMPSAADHQQGVARDPGQGTANSNRLQGYRRRPGIS